MSAARVAALAVATLCAAATTARTETLPPGPLHDYVLSCAGCHRLDGSGSARVPSFRDTGRLLARDGGRDYLLRVPGAAQAPLSDARLAALLNWVLTRFGGVVPEPPFTAGEVAAARATPLRDPRQARAALR
jgi:mono/diheme cytochrome c family protein